MTARRGNPPCGYVAASRAASRAAAERRLSAAAREVNAQREAYEADARTLRDALGTVCPPAPDGADAWARALAAATDRVALRARLLATAVEAFGNAELLIATTPTT